MSEHWALTTTLPRDGWVVERTYRDGVKVAWRAWRMSRLAFILSLDADRAVRGFRKVGEARKLDEAMAHSQALAAEWRNDFIRLADAVPRRRWRDRLRSLWS